MELTRNLSLSLHRLTEFKALLGRGAYGRVEGKEVYVGSLRLLKGMRIEVEDPKIKELQEQGKTVVFTIIDGKLAGAFALADKIRKEEPTEHHH